MNAENIEKLIAFLEQYAVVFLAESVQGLALIRCRLDSGVEFWAVQLRFVGSGTIAFNLIRRGQLWGRHLVGDFELVKGLPIRSYIAGATRGLRKDLRSCFHNTSVLEPILGRACGLLEELDLNRLYMLHVNESEIGGGYAFSVRHLLGERTSRKEDSLGSVYLSGLMFSSSNPQYRQNFRFCLSGWEKTSTRALDGAIHSAGLDPQTGIGPSVLRSMVTQRFSGISCHAHC